jgi:hypothetical protein
MGRRMWETGLGPAISKAALDIRKPRHARGAMAPGICGSSSLSRTSERGRSAGRRNQLRAHEARRALWSSAHASRRSTAAIALISREMITGLGPRFAGGIGASLSASSSRPARSGQAGGAPRPPECPADEPDPQAPHPAPSSERHRSTPSREQN